MKKIIFSITAFVFLAMASFSAFAQKTETKPTEKNEITTLDSWRQALPDKEEPYYKPPAEKDSEVIEETAIDVQKKIINLEQSLIKAHQQGDAAAFKNLLADDFMPAGINLSGAKPDKTRYIAWTLKNSELKPYVIEKIKVRVYGTTALATVDYKKPPATADAPAVVTLTATDVWVKSGMQWQLVSHQTSQQTNP